MEMKEEIKSYRYELKYVLNSLDYLKFESILNLHPAGFKTLFPDRWVNNIYFDDHEKSCALENLAGVSERTKIRFRWYGEATNFHKGVLELKIKKNALGTKRYFQLDDILSLDMLKSKVCQLLVKYNLVPSLQNRYLRSYFIDFNQNYRVTVDRKVSYGLPDKDINALEYSYLMDDRIIVEIKFDNEDHALFSKISDAFPFRLSKHSKYVSGIMGLSV